MRTTTYVTFSFLNFKRKTTFYSTTWDQNMQTQFFSPTSKWGEWKCIWNKKLLSFWPYSKKKPLNQEEDGAFADWQLAVDILSTIKSKTELHKINIFILQQSRWDEIQWPGQHVALCLCWWTSNADWCVIIEKQKRRTGKSPWNCTNALKTNRERVWWCRCVLQAFTE